MSSEDMGLVPSQRLENGLNSHLVFPDDALRFNCGAPTQRRVGDPGPKTRDLSGFIDERFFAPQGADFRRSMYGGDGQDRRDPPEARNWNGNGAAATPSVDGSDEDEDEEDDEDDVDDDDEVDEGVEGLVGGDENNNKGNSGNNAGNGEDKMGNGKAKHQHHSPFGKKKTTSGCFYL